MKNLLRRFLLLAALASVRAHAVLQLSHYGDVLAFVRLREIVPAAPIKGYQKYAEDESKARAVYLDGDPLLALPFGRNAAKSPTHRLFPVYRLDPKTPQILQLGFAFEMVDDDLDGKMIGYMGVWTGLGISSNVKEQLIKMRTIWRAELSMAAAPLLTHPQDEWGRVPPYKNQALERGDFLAVSLFRIDLEKHPLNLVNAVVFGLEHALIAQGCDGELAVYEPRSHAQ